MVFNLVVQISMFSLHYIYIKAGNVQYFSVFRTPHWCIALSSLNPQIILRAWSFEEDSVI